MLFISAQQLPSFLTWDTSESRRGIWFWLPRLKPRQVPITVWLLQVITFASGTLLNNLAFAFSVPLTLQIVFRSAGNFNHRIFSLTTHTCYSSLPSLISSSWTFIAELLGSYRTSRVHATRPIFHGQAIHAQTNSTSPFLQQLPPRVLTVSFSPPFRKPK